MLIEIAEKILNGIFACIPQSKPNPSHIEDIKLIAHRGAHSKLLGVIENTMHSFERAKALRCWGVEIDIHATLDGVIVVNHDPTLHRLWGHPVAIANLTFDALRALEPRIPTLKEVIDTFGTTLHYFIEIKIPFHSEDALIDILKDLKPCQDYHLLSLEEPLFTTLTKFPKKSLMLVPVHNNVRKFCKLSLQKGYGGVLGNYLLLTNAYIYQLLAANQQVGVGFVNSQNSLYRELKRPIPWLFSDNVDTVRTSLDQYIAQHKTV